MKRFKLLLLDANVVIELFRLGIWEKVIQFCDVHVARTVMEQEAQFYETDDGEKCYFDLASFHRAGEISVFDMTPADLETFRGSFDPSYFEKLDPGETESLAYLLSLQEKGWICSADKIVFRILGNLYRGQLGISLEEVLQAIGFGRQLTRQFSKSYREKWTRKGSEERIRGLGLRE